jgi:predicted Zn-dependent protease
MRALRHFRFAILDLRLKSKIKNLKSKIRMLYAIIPLLVLVNNPSFAQGGASKSEYELGLSARDFMVRKYSKVGDEAILNRVQGIWRKVTRVADQRSGVRYRIDVLDTDTVGAWAYPGGFILLTRGLIDIATTDDELAFVIAHELGHQARGHVDKPMEPELEEKYRDIIVEHGIDGQGFVNEFVSEVTKRKEIEADHYGVLYTSLAGYSVSAAFSTLDKVITSDKTKTHPSKEVRQQRLQERLEEIISKLEVFETGVIFYNIEKYGYAESAFLNFLSVYPSREVYNNLAVTFHQEALIYYTPKRNIPTKKTMQIDLETRAKRIDVTARDIWSKTKEDFEQALNEAIETYKRAIKQDPDYAISYNNLGCAYDDLGEFDFAVVWLKKAIKMQNDYKEAHNNLGVAYIHLGEFDEAIAGLKEAIQLDVSYADAYFNLAMAYEALGQAGETVAENLTLFLEHNLDKRSNLVEIAREKLGLETTVSAANSSPTGLRRKISRRTLEEKLGPPARSVDVIPTEGIRVHLYPDKGTRLITSGSRGSTAFSALDKVICIIADSQLAGPTPEGIWVDDTKEQLMATHGEPQKITEMAGLLHYLYADKGSLFSLRDQKVSSWIVWFETR